MSLFTILLMFFLALILVRVLYTVCQQLNNIDFRLKTMHFIKTRVFPGEDDNAELTRREEGDLPSSPPPTYEETTRDLFTARDHHFATALASRDHHLASRDVFTAVGTTVFVIPQINTAMTSQRQQHHNELPSYDSLFPSGPDSSTHTQTHDTTPADSDRDSLPLITGLLGSSTSNSTSDSTSNSTSNVSALVRQPASDGGAVLSASEDQVMALSPIAELQEVSEMDSALPVVTGSYTRSEGGSIAPAAISDESSTTTSETTSETTSDFTSGGRDSLPPPYM